MYVCTYVQPPAPIFEMAMLALNCKESGMLYFEIEYWLPLHVAMGVCTYVHVRVD